MGFGTSPFGRFPFASMGPAASPDPLRPAPTPGAPTAARARILTLAGDYALKTDGTNNLAEAPDYVDAEVLWRLRTQRGSFAGRVDIGNGVGKVNVWTDAAEVATRDAVTQALQPMIDRGVIRNVVVSIAPVVQNGTAINVYSVSYDKTGIVERFS